MWNSRCFQFLQVLHQNKPIVYRSLSNDLIRNRIYVDGKWIQTSCLFPVRNPADNNLVAQAPETSEEQLQQAIAAAWRAFPKWSALTDRERSKYIRRLFELQTKHSDQLAQIISMEMGKPLNEAKGEIAYGASFFEWFAEQSKRVHGEILSSPWPGRQVRYTREPIGPIAIITPWNFPNAMITRKLGAVLAAGCTAVVRPAHNSPFSALALADLAEQAELPPGVLNVTPSCQASAPAFAKVLCEHPHIAGISFTGSTAVGKILLQLCSANIKRACLELGGNAPFLVFESADLDKAVSGLIIAKFRNGGQTCVCANRILVHESIHDEFVLQLADAMRNQLRLGNPLDEGTTIGPLVSADALLKVQEHVQDAIANGAKLVVGGQAPSHLSSQGHFFEPTLLTNVSERSRLCHEETFGPVAAVFKFSNEEQALCLANSCEVGLAGYVYSENHRQINRVVRSLQVGMVGVNEAMISAAEVPFGGIKQSGLGREGSHFGIDEFTNIKYICEHLS